MITNTTGCAAENCAQKSNCVRYANYLHQIAESETLNILNPQRTVPSADDCPHYCIAVTQRIAYGFRLLAGSVPKFNIPYLPEQANIGSRTTYYRAYRGERPLYLADQQHLLAVIKELGGNPALPFDRYSDEQVIVSCK